mmetsp:Transcript_30681/g.45414  ORF Transcript_30681/g.45414 Transcript_30681/m.45414 type:complete len:1071 (+) Transcript_30681:134-3346(+)
MCDHLEVVPLSASFGAEIRGLNLTTTPLPPECQSRVFSIWNDYSVILIRNQFNLSEETLFRFSKGLGDPKPAGSRGYYLREGNPHGSGRSSPIPEVSVMSNLDASGKPQAVTGGHGSQSVDWHQDDSYTNTPARGALLYNTFHPSPRPYPTGNTSFCDLYRAYETFDASKHNISEREELEKLHLVHDISRNSAYHVRPGLTLPRSYGDVIGPAHPLVITHPLTGRKALHLGRNPPAPSSYILEQNNSEGHQLFQSLWDHATSPENTWTHNSWRPGDLLIWDNLATMHKRSLVDPNQRREMLRILLRGSSEGLVGPTYLKTIRTTANDKADAEAKAAAKMGGINNDAKIITADGSILPKDAVSQMKARNGTDAFHANVTGAGSSVSQFAEVNGEVTVLEDMLNHPNNYIMTISLLTVMLLGLFVTFRKRYGKRFFYSLRISKQSSLSPATSTSITSETTTVEKAARVKVKTTSESLSNTMVKAKEITANPFAYLAEGRVQLFWWSFLCIYLFFQSFSCGRADRLWRISDIFDNAPNVLLKPYGISSMWYAFLLPYLHHIETAVLFMMILLASPASLQSQPPSLLQLRRFLSFGCGLGWLFLHSYEHSMTGGSHTHLMPAICMIAMGILPAPSSWNMIRWWNVFLLFSAGISKLFNGYPQSHPFLGAWMDGQSMQFYFDNSRQAVPEPWNTWTMENDWFAALQCTGSVFLELSTCLLFWQPYRLAFPFLGMAFHGVIWYTLGVNYLTSVIIQFTLVLDADDWKCLRKHANGLLQSLRLLLDSSNLKAKPEATSSDTNPNTNASITSRETATYQLPTPPVWARVIVWLNPILMFVVIVTQMEFWPLSNIPMYSGYRPRIGFNTTHIANMAYLENLVSESAPHVWSRHWTDIMVHMPTNSKKDDQSFKMSFCVPSPQFNPLRGVKEFCLVPEQRQLDSERESHNEENKAYRLDDSSDTVKHSIRVGGWNRQKPMVVVAEMLHRNNKRKNSKGGGRQHTYCQHESLSPAEDFLLRNCVFLKSFPQIKDQEMRTELVVHLGTGEDLVLGSVNCHLTEEHPEYSVDQVPPCVQNPWH